MFDQEPRTNLGILPDLEVETQQESSVEDAEEGYATPTSEERKIPARRSPPPPPKKRRLFVMDTRTTSQTVEIFRGRFVEEGELESFFKLLETELKAAPPPPPVPEPEQQQGTNPKRIRSD